ncbi:FtsQ-type POTRA domain-containing protein [Collinsella sp. zg1085]|uniref:cell division protein FtsQ/DivIB n=1 Tax=Collinsella sp. zg1085 TaxID=2844380 RepID=UPI001C0DE445|nr:FtsQ-type POTRA domain-containing protein [Collinsella sp. zg1085]QWT18046.1 FtsQ-type POTRA domain-containing protein [Collinsella sp. zg1085]
MALSFNRKSNSSASKASKPTFRRAPRVPAQAQASAPVARETGRRVSVPLDAPMHESLPHPVAEKAPKRAPKIAPKASLSSQKKLSAPTQAGVRPSARSVSKQNAKLMGPAVQSGARQAVGSAAHLTAQATLLSKKKAQAPRKRVAMGSNPAQVEKSVQQNREAARVVLSRQAVATTRKKAMPTKRGVHAAEQLASAQGREKKLDSTAQSADVAAVTSRGSATTHTSFRQRLPKLSLFSRFARAGARIASRTSKQPLQASVDEHVSVSPQKKFAFAKPLFRVLMVLVALALVALITFVVLAQSPLFEVSEQQLVPTEHVSSEDLTSLLDMPKHSSLLTLNESAIKNSLMQSPWIRDVRIERRFPHTLIITPKEYTIAAIAYIAADDVAWAISSDGTWIAPLTLATTVDAEGKIIQDMSQVPEGTETIQKTGAEAAQLLAQQAHAVLFTDIATDVAPKSGQLVESELVKAGLSYATGFSSEFIAQIKSMSIRSIEAIAATLASGVEVSLGVPENITTKERVIQKLLAEQQGITYINVRTPDSYTFRAAPTS